MELEEFGEENVGYNPCWDALNDLILEEGEKRVKACHKWRERFGKEHEGSGGGAGGSWGQRLARLRRSERLVKKQRCSHTDEEDPGGICVRMGAVSLENRWGTEVENYSVSLGWVRSRREGVEEDRAGENDIENKGVNLCIDGFLFFFLRSGKGEGRRRGGGVTVTVVVFVSCQLFGVVVMETAFITFDGAGLDLANLVTL